MSKNPLKPLPRAAGLLQPPSPPGSSGDTAKLERLLRRAGNAPKSPPVAQRGFFATYNGLPRRSRLILSGLAVVASLAGLQWASWFEDQNKHHWEGDQAPKKYPETAVERQKRLDRMAADDARMRELETTLAELEAADASAPSRSR